MTVLEKRVTFLGKIVRAEETHAAGRGDSPRNAIAVFERRSSQIRPRRIRTEGGDGAHNFVAEHAWTRTGTASMHGVQIACTNGGATDTDQNLAGTELGQGMLSDEEWFVWTVKHRDGTSRSLVGGRRKSHGWAFHQEG